MSITELLVLGNNSRSTSANQTEPAPYHVLVLDQGPSESLLFDRCSAGPHLASLIAAKALVVSRCSAKDLACLVMPRDGPLL